MPSTQDFKLQVAESLVRQHERRVRMEGELLARYGCNAIRPFFILGTIFDGPLGRWLIGDMRLLPFDEWNVVYLPTDAATAAALYLPLHPKMNIAVLDGWITKQVTAYHEQYSAVRQRIDQAYARTGNPDLARAFDKDAEKMRDAILQWVATITPTVIEGIAEGHRKAQ